MATASAPMGSIGGAALPPGQDQQKQAPAQPPAPPRPERLNPVMVQQLNLESVKTRALGLSKAISRILEEFDVIARANAVPKWSDVLGHFSMVNLELFNVVEDIKKVSKAFVVHPKNVNAENATILPVMLSSKLLPEIEAEDNAKRDQLLHGMQNLPIPMQIEKLKNRIDLIGAACESAEKVLADFRKAYGLGSRQGQVSLPVLDKAQAAKIQEQENSLRAAVNFGEGLQLHGEQRHISSSLPMHLAEVLGRGEGLQNVGDMSGMQQKNVPPSFSSSNSSNQGSMMQASGTQLIGRSAPSPSGISGTASFDNASTPPLPYTNSPRSSANLMNTPSPQQPQQHQRQKMMQLSPHQQQLIVQQQQLRQSSTPALLGQNTIQQMHDIQGQAQQKFQQVQGQHQMQYSQPLAQQQFHNRQLQSGHMQHNMGQSQMNQGNQLRSNISQLTGNTGNNLFNTTQSSQNSQMMPNISATIPSPSVLPRVQYGLAGGHPQRGYPSQILNDQMFNMGGSNPTNITGMQQQQQFVGQGVSGSLQSNAQNLQTGMAGLQNTGQNPNFTQRQQNQQ